MCLALSYGRSPSGRMDAKRCTSQITASVYGSLARFVSAGRHSVPIASRISSLTTSCTSGLVESRSSTQSSAVVVVSRPSRTHYILVSVVSTRIFNVKADSGFRPKTSSQIFCFTTTSSRNALQFQLLVVVYSTVVTKHAFMKNNNISSGIYTSVTLRYA